MRNLAQYPVTDTELLKYLEDLQEEVNTKYKDCVGSMQPLYVKELRRRVLYNTDAH